MSKRLVVELTTKANEALSRRVAAEDLNMTTIVNRALQVYDKVMQIQEDGGHILFEASDGIIEGQVIM
jgi:hypothetical protein